MMPDPTVPTHCDPGDQPGDPRFNVGLLVDVAAAVEAHGYDPLNGGQLIELQLHLFHLLHGDPDAPARVVSDDARMETPSDDPAFPARPPARRPELRVRDDALPGVVSRRPVPVGDGPRPGLSTRRLRRLERRCRRRHGGDPIALATLAAVRAVLLDRGVNLPDA